jgi:hypothetical protein
MNILHALWDCAGTCESPAVYRLLLRRANYYLVINHSLEHTTQLTSAELIITSFVTRVCLKILRSHGNEFCYAHKINELKR